MNRWEVSSGGRSSNVCLRLIGPQMSRRPFLIERWGGGGGGEIREAERDDDDDDAAEKKPGVMLGFK